MARSRAVRESRREGASQHGAMRAAAGNTGNPGMTASVDISELQVLPLCQGGARGAPCTWHCMMAWQMDPMDAAWTAAGGPARGTSFY